MTRKTGVLSGLVYFHGLAFDVRANNQGNGRKFLHY